VAQRAWSLWIISLQPAVLVYHSDSAWLAAAGDIIEQLRVRNVSASSTVVRALCKRLPAEHCQQSMWFTVGPTTNGGVLKCPSPKSTRCFKVPWLQCAWVAPNQGIDAVWHVPHAQPLCTLRRIWYAATEWLNTLMDETASLAGGFSGAQRPSRWQQMGATFSALPMQRGAACAVNGEALCAALVCHT
jgi:hypothetical protein